MLVKVLEVKLNPVNLYMFRVNNRNARIMVWNLLPIKILKLKN